jgi:hypothetical protein
MHKDDVPKLTVDLVQIGIQVMSINSSHSLENYFLSLTTQASHVEAFAN